MIIRPTLIRSSLNINYYNEDGLGADIREGGTFTAEALSSTSSYRPTSGGMVDASNMYMDADKMSPDDGINASLLMDIMMNLSRQDKEIVIIRGTSTASTETFYINNNAATVDVVGGRFEIAIGKTELKYFTLGHGSGAGGSQTVTSVDLRGTFTYQPASTTIFQSLARDCTSLTTATFGKSLVQQTSIAYILYGSGVKVADFTDSITSTLTNINLLCGNSADLERVILDGCDLSGVDSGGSINPFYGCPKLTEISAVGCSQATIDLLRSVAPAGVNIKTT